MKVFNKILTVALTLILTTALAEPSKYDDYGPVLLCEKLPGGINGSLRKIAILCLYPRVEKIDSGQGFGLGRYYFKPILGYKCEGDMWLNQSNRINEEDAEEYEFKSYHKILKILEALEKNASKRSWREKRDNRIATIAMPAEYRDDFFDFLAKFDPKIFAKLQKIKNVVNKNIEVTNSILAKLKNSELAQTLVISELDARLSELKLNADKQRNIVELILIKLQKDIARALINNYKSIFYVAKVNYKNNDPTCNALKNIIRFATKIESKLHISMNEALEISIGLNDSSTFTNIKFPGNVKRELVIDRLKALANKYDYNENIGSIVAHLDVILKRNTQSMDNQYKKLIEISIRNFEKARLSQEASISNLKEADKITKLKELAQRSPNNFYEDSKIIVGFTENYFNPLVWSYKFEIYFRGNSFQNESVSDAYLKRYAKIRGSILLEYIKNHDINELNDLTEPYNETKDDFIKQIQNFDWKEVGKFPLEEEIKELHLSRNIIDKLDREIDSLKSFESDPERNLEKIGFRYKGLFTFIDKWFDKYYNDY